MIVLIFICIIFLILRHIAIKRPDTKIEEIVEEELRNEDIDNTETEETAEEEPEVKVIENTKIEEIMIEEKQEPKSEVIDGNNSFVSLDVETINSNGGVCSIGIALYKDDKLVDKYYSLVCPENSVENQFNVRVCGINYDMVKNERHFSEIWKEIEKYLMNYTIVGHNISYDINQLIKIMDQSNMRVPEFTAIDTIDLAKEKIITDSYSLDKISTILGVNCNNHHNSLSDAIMTGEVYIKLLQLDEILEVRDVVSIDDFKFDNYNKMPDEEDKPVFELSGKRCTLTGVFSEYNNRDVLMQKLFNLGVIINKGLTKKTDVLICGNVPGPSKLTKADEMGIRIVNESELYKLIESASEELSEV